MRLAVKTIKLIMIAVTIDLSIILFKVMPPLIVFLRMLFEKVSFFGVRASQILLKIWIRGYNLVLADIF